MEVRADEFRSEIAAIEPPAPYMMITAQVDYTSLDNTFKQRPNTWNQLVPGVSTTQKEAPPNFTAIMKDVVPSKRKEMLVGKQVKVHVVSPEKPYGQWLGVGDVIRECKIISITHDFIIIEKYKGKNRYAHKYPRK